MLFQVISKNIQMCILQQLTLNLKGFLNLISNFKISLLQSKSGLYPTLPKSIFFSISMHQMLVR